MFVSEDIVIFASKNNHQDKRETRNSKELIVSNVEHFVLRIQGKILNHIYDVAISYS